jgi:hypothetical protein
MTGTAAQMFRIPSKLAGSSVLSVLLHRITVIPGSMALHIFFLAWKLPLSPE